MFSIPPRWKIGIVTPWIALGSYLPLPDTCQAQSSKPATVRVVETEDAKRLTIKVNDQDVLSYAVATIQPPAGIDAVFAHSGHLHPVRTPKGQVVTAEFPADHAHQHGMFNAWVNTTFEGRKVDFWNQKEKSGKVEHVRTVSKKDGDEFGEFVVDLVHSDVTQKDPIPVLNDRVTVRVWKAVQPAFFIDIESRQTLLANSPLTINEYHYGGMAFRGRSEWLGKEGAKFRTSEGKGRVDGNHSRPHWVALEGSLDGQVCTVVAMGHPENFRHPEPTRLHPDKPYFVFSPSFLGAFERQKGVEYLARYRYCIADGTVSPDTANQWWEAYRQGKLPSP